MTKTKLFLWAMAVVGLLGVGAFIGNVALTTYQHLVNDHLELHAMQRYIVREIQEKAQAKPQPLPRP